MSDLVEDWGAHRRIPGVQLRVVQHDELVFEGASGHTTRWGSRQECVNDDDESQDR